MVENDQELAVLVPLAVDGERRALQRIIQIVYPAVLRYARARIGGGKHPTAEDVTQEVCLAVATSIDKYEDKGRPFMAYVYGIAFNKVADAHRAMGRDKTSPTEDVPESADDAGTPEDFAIAEDGSNTMRNLLDTLSDKARDIVILRTIVGMSAEETAGIVGSTPGAVRVAQHRALAQLRKTLESSAAYSLKQGDRQ